MEKPMRFALFGNVYQPEKSLSVQKLLTLLEQKGAEILIDEPFYTHLTERMHIDMPQVNIICGNEFEADVVVSMGGDGTFLEAARRVGNSQTPILGVNMGRLGFLADFKPEDLPEAITQIYNGELKEEERTVLQVSYSIGTTKDYPYALNEVAVLKRDNSSMISIRVDIDGQYLTTYQADGLIINTPTGSTGYALSVGGSVMVPGSNIMGIVPVAPHSLNVRPITLSDNMEIKLTVESRSHNFLVAIDGRSEKCQEGTIITIRRAPYNVRVLKRNGGTFFHTLRSKLMWGSDVRG